MRIPLRNLFFCEKNPLSFFCEKVFSTKLKKNFFRCFVPKMEEDPSLRGPWYWATLPGTSSMLRRPGPVWVPRRPHLGLCPSRPAPPPPGSGTATGSTAPAAPTAWSAAMPARSPRGRSAGVPRPSWAIGPGGQLLKPTSCSGRLCATMHARVCIAEV